MKVKVGCSGNMYGGKVQSIRPFRYIYQAELSLDFEGLEELLFVIGFGILTSDFYALRYE